VGQRQRHTEVIEGGRRLACVGDVVEGAEAVVAMRFISCRWLPCDSDVVYTVRWLVADYQ
jgi:hypothetical protein